MTENPVEGALTRGSIRTPRAAAFAGILFSVLLAIALVLIRLSVPEDADDARSWITDTSKRNAALVALNLLPFACIAFLWFIGVVRDTIGDREDRFFATVFLGSGLLFVAMLLTAAAIAGALLFAADDVGVDQLAGVWSFGRRTTFTLLMIYAMRMAAVFTISTTTIVSRHRLVPRPLAIFGFVTGGLLLLTAGLTPWLELIFPLWVLVISINILVRQRSTAAPIDGALGLQQAT